MNEHPTDEIWGCPPFEPLVEEDPAWAAYGPPLSGSSTPTFVGPAHISLGKPQGCTFDNVPYGWWACDNIPCLCALGMTDREIHKYNFTHHPKPRP